VFVAMAALAIYGLVLYWFMIWRGLGFSKLKAILALLVIHIGTGALVMLPQVLSGGGPTLIRAGIR
jgi:hypothetical protein